MRTGTKIAVMVIVVLAIVPITLAYISYSPDNGTVSIYVHDTPVASASAVYITFSAVSVHGNSTGWTNYSVGTSTLDILGLTTSNASLLKSITLTAEQYTMMRLYIQKVSAVINGVNTTFRLSSSFAFINGPFSVQKLTTTTISIDFNLQQCLNMNSRVFTPNIGFTVS